MHTDPPDTLPEHRLMTDGGRRAEPTTRSQTVHAKAVDEMEIGGEQREVLRVPISSTRPDREGDRFAKEALERMAEQIEREKPLVFQNHGLAGDFMGAIPYDQSETIGTHHDAEVVQADDGEYDLMAMVNPDGTHPEGERMLKQVRDEGQAVKFSVGFNIQGYEAREEMESDYQGDGRVFTSVDLMEDSKVGVPANPDASAPVEASAKQMGQMPGVQMHPMTQMLQAMQGGASPPEARTAEVKTPDHSHPDPSREQSGTEPSVSRAPEDMSENDLLTFTATHYDGMDESDFMDAADAGDAEYIGECDTEALADLISTVTGAEYEEAANTLDDLMGGDGDDGDGEENSGVEEIDPVRRQVAELSATVGDLRAELSELREENQGVVESLSEDEIKVEGGCDADADCPEGEVCMDGECVPEDEVEESADPEGDDLEDLSEDELRAEVREAREQLSEGTEAPESTDTTTEEPDFTDEGNEPDDEKDSEPDAGNAEARPLTNVR